MQLEVPQQLVRDDGVSAREEEEEETADQVTLHPQLLFETLSDRTLRTLRHPNVSSWQPRSNDSSQNSPLRYQSNSSPISSSLIDITFLPSTYSICYSLGSTGRCTLQTPLKMTLFDELFEFELSSFSDIGSSTISWTTFTLRRR